MAAYLEEAVRLPLTVMARCAPFNYLEAPASTISCQLPTPQMFLPPPESLRVDITKLMSAALEKQTNGFIPTTMAALCCSMHPCR